MRESRRHRSEFLFDSWIDYYYLWCRLSPWYFCICVYCPMRFWCYFGTIIGSKFKDWFIVMSSVCHLRSTSFLVTSTRAQSLIKLRWFPRISPLHLNNSKRFFFQNNAIASLCTNRKTEKNLVHLSHKKKRDYLLCTMKRPMIPVAASRVVSARKSTG